nr:PRA1 family protein B4-like [Ipomoea batatas]
MVGVAAVCAHAAFRDPEDLFLDEQEPPTVGFLSFLTGAATTASAPGRIIRTTAVSAHAAFRDPEDLFLDEQEPPTVGFLSFLTGAATTASVPGVAPRI